MQDFILVTGFMNLVNDATTVLMAASIPVTAVVVGWFAFQRSQADEMDQKAWGKRMRNALICGAVVLTSTAFVNAIFAYFK